MSDYGVGTNILQLMVVVYYILGKHPNTYFQIATIAACFIRLKSVPNLRMFKSLIYMEMGGDGHLFTGC